MDVATGTIIFFGSIIGLGFISGFFGNSSTSWNKGIGTHPIKQRSSDNTTVPSNVNFVQILQQKSSEGYVLGFDTDSLFSHPNLLDLLPPATPILLSSSLVEEVQKKRMDASLGFKANHIWQLIEKTKIANSKIQFPIVDNDFLLKHKLDPSQTVERTIGSYLKTEKQHLMTVLFVSPNVNALKRAEAAGLSVMEIPGGGHSNVVSLQTNNQQSFTPRNNEERLLQLLAAKVGTHTLGFDTNILLDFPTLIEKLGPKANVFLSKTVIEELDKKKNDERLSTAARTAMHSIERLQRNSQVLKVVNANNEFLESHNLNPRSPDERIIGSYLREKKDRAIEVLFISSDTVARVLARDNGLAVLDM